jgi:hypothetical protein
MAAACPQRSENGGVSLLRLRHAPYPFSGALGAAQKNPGLKPGV